MTVEMEAEEKRTFLEFSEEAIERWSGFNFNAFVSHLSSVSIVQTDQVE